MNGFTVLAELGLIAASVTAAAIPAPSASLHDAFNSQQACAYTAKIAGFGERWPGSPGHKVTEELIHQAGTAKRWRPDRSRRFHRHHTTRPCPRA